MTPEQEEARQRMIEKRFGGNANGAIIGGAGAQRRKIKGKSQSVGDDKKLGGVLKKMNLQEIKGLEEVNIFLEDGDVIHITNPKVQSSGPSNTYVVSGNSERKRLEECVPGILTQLADYQMDKLRAYAEAMQAQGAGAGPEDDEDEEMPELVENFEEAAAAETAK